MDKWLISLPDSTLIFLHEKRSRNVVFYATGIHQWLLNNSAGWILFDALFYSMPLLYLYVYKYVSKLASSVAIIMLVVNWFYVQCYTLYPSNSIEGHIAWLFFPIIFIPSNEK